MKKIITMTIYISLGSFILGGCGAGIANGDAACDTAKANFVNNVTINKDNIEGYPGLEVFVRDHFIEPVLAKEAECVKKTYVINGIKESDVFGRIGEPGSDKRVMHCAERSRNIEGGNAGFQLAGKVAMFCFE